MFFCPPIAEILVSGRGVAKIVSSNQELLLDQVVSTTRMADEYEPPSTFALGAAAPPGCVAGVSHVRFEASV